MPQRPRFKAKRGLHTIYITPIAASISFENAIISPPRRHRKPCERWLASWLWTDIPTCTMPQPRIIIPTALMQEKIKSEKLLTTVSGSLPVAKAEVTKTVAESTSAVKSEAKRS